ncbi:hypothetical protein D9M72_574700 [compost metagenome]
MPARNGSRIELKTMRKAMKAASTSSQNITWRCNPEPLTLISMTLPLDRDDFRSGRPKIITVVACHKRGRDAGGKPRTLFHIPRWRAACADRVSQPCKEIGGGAGAGQVQPGEAARFGAMLLRFYRGIWAKC